MTNSIYRVSLDIHDSGSQISLNVKKGDTKRSIIATLTENGRPYTIADDCTAVFTAKKPDGNIIYNACVILGNAIHYDITSQTTAVAGAVPCELRIYGGEGEQLTSPRFTLIVDPTVYSDGEVVEESTNEVTELTQLVSEANVLIKTVQSKLDNGEFVGTGYVLTNADKKDIAVLVKANMDVASADPVFENNSWETIIAACQLGAVPDTWNIGDQKSMRISGVDYVFDIIGMNHDDYADGSGKAPLTFQLHDCFVSKHYMNSSGTNNGGWTSSDMRTDTLSDILTVMPAAVRNGIKEVNKLTTAGGKSGTIVTSADKLFLLSDREVQGVALGAANQEGTQYAYYARGGSKVKNYNGTASSWWLRSPMTSLIGYFQMITTTGSSDGGSASSNRGVSFAFCF